MTIEFVRSKSKIIDFSIAFTIFELITLSSIMSSSLEVTTIGFGAPLIHRNSPKHPLYNPHTTSKDIMRHKQQISFERQRYFTNQKLISERGRRIIPVDPNVVISYSIGTPSVYSSAMFDTRSDIIWLQCQPCVKCFKQDDPIFDPKKSSTYQQVKCPSQICTENGFSCSTQLCSYDIHYIDGSASHGVVGIDTLTLPDNELSPQLTLPDAIFGCGNDNNNNFTFGTSGTIGLKNSSVSLIGQTHVDKFAYCKSGDGGYIYFGSESELIGSRTTLFTDSFGNYQVILLGIAFGYSNGDLNVTINLDIPSDIFKVVENNPNTGVLVDAGTPYTFLHPVAWDALIRKIGDLLDLVEFYETYNWRLCYNSDLNPEVMIDTFSSVHLLFDQNATIILPKENVWTGKDEEGNICLKMFPNETNMTVIGSEQLINFNVGYDLKGNSLWLDYSLACNFY